MQEHIEKFNQIAINVDHNNLPVGLYHGKMGLCIYFYEFARLTSEKKYRIIADKIFDDTVNSVTEHIEIDSSNGLTGICMAVDFLIESGYIKGNPDHILKNYDDKIIQSLLFNRMLDANPSLDTIKIVMGNLAYCTTRLQNTKLPNNERIIIQGAIIEVINKIESLAVDKFTEPPAFSLTAYFIPLYLQLLKRLYLLNFYNYKIVKIIDDMSPQILSLYPLNKANRLLLCSAMSEINAIAGNIAGWDRHIELLKQDIDIHQIIHEFRNKDLTFNKGLCGFYYLLRKTGIKEEYNDLFINRIENSDIWVHFLEKDSAYIKPFSLYDGVPGVILTYLHILNRSNTMMFFDKVIG